MRFVPTLLLSRALCLPTTAHSKGGHGGANSCLARSDYATNSNGAHIVSSRSHRHSHGNPVDGNFPDREIEHGELTGPAMPGWVRGIST